MQLELREMIRELVREELGTATKNQTEVVNPWAAYPIFLASKHVADACQIANSTAVELMIQSGLVLSSSKSGKSKRVPRDSFFEWYLKRLVQQTG